jgi:hypothetical protein
MVAIAIVSVVIWDRSVSARSKPARHLLKAQTVPSQSSPCKNAFGWKV